MEEIKTQFLNHAYFNTMIERDIAKLNKLVQIQEEESQEPKSAQMEVTQPNMDNGDWSTGGNKTCHGNTGQLEEDLEEILEEDLGHMEEDLEEVFGSSCSFCVAEEGLDL